MFIWTISDIVGVTILVLIGITYILINNPDWIKQITCKHEKYHETQACDAVCSKCGKNLGFIGNLYRDK